LIRFVFTAAAAKHDRRRRDDVFGTVMLAESEEIESETVGQFDLFHQIAQTLRAGHERSVDRVERDLNE
jgi:hypothetical protein